MKRQIFLLLVGGFISIGLATARAGDVTLNFTAPSPYSQVYAGVYTGIYLGTINGSGPTVDFVCDDFIDHISGGESWSALVGQTNPVSSGVLFGPTNPNGTYPITNPTVLAADGNTVSQQQEYNMVTYLANLIFADPTNSAGQWEYESWAIWSITDGGWSYDGGEYYTPQVQAYVTLALAAENTNNGNLTVYTPTVSGDGQEFLTTPEPSSLILMGSLLVLAAALLAKCKLLA